MLILTKNMLIQWAEKKDLLLDNQYIPALETDEELDKLADKLKLPKDMEYRRELLVSIS